MGSGLSAAGGCRQAAERCAVSCVPTEEVEAQQAERDMLRRLSVDGLEIVKSQRVAKDTDGENSTVKGRLLVLWRRPVLGATLMFTDVISSPSGEMQTGDLPLSHGQITRSSCSVEVVANAAIHPDCAHASEAFSFACASEVEATEWESTLREAMAAAEAECFGVSLQFLREEYEQWQRVVRTDTQNQAIQVGEWYQIASWCGGSGLSVRLEAELTSEEVGDLRLGEQILVLQKQQLNVSEGGFIVRVRFERGWVTAEHSDGTRLLEPRGPLLSDYRAWLESRLVCADSLEDSGPRTRRRVPFTHHLVRSAPACGEDQDSVTRSKGSSESLQFANCKVSRATVYVSHSDCSCTLVSDFFEALLRSLHEDDFAWIDIYSHNLFTNIEGTELRAKQAQQYVSSCSRMVVLITPWPLAKSERLSPAMKSWSLWELACATSVDHERKVPLELACSEAQLQALRMVIVEDVARAASRIPTDEDFDLDQPYFAETLMVSQSGPTNSRTNVAAIHRLLKEMVDGCDELKTELRDQMVNVWVGLLRTLIAEEEANLAVATAEAKEGSHNLYLCRLDREDCDAKAAARETDWRMEFQWVFAGHGDYHGGIPRVTVDERASDWTTATVGKARAWLQMREIAGDTIGAAEVDDFLNFQRSHADELEYAKLCGNIGMIFRDKLQQPMEALSLQEHALAAHVRIYGEAHPVVGQDYAEIGLTHSLQENFTRALEYYDTTHTIFLQVYGLGSIQLAGLQCRIAECYRQQHDLKRALTLYEEARAVQSDMQPHELCTASTFIAIARIHVETIDRDRTIRAGVFVEHPEAYGPPLDCLMHALKIYETRLGLIHLECLRVVFALGEVYARQMNHTKAVEFFQRTLVMLRDDELDGLSDKHDHDEVQAIASIATAQTMLCQAMLATSQAVLRQLNSRPIVVIDAPDSVNVSGVYRFAAVQDGWPRFETLQGKQLFHTSDGFWYIRQPKVDDQVITSIETMPAKTVDEDAADADGQQRQQLNSQPGYYQLSVLAVDGLLPEGSCAWQLEPFDGQEGEETRQVTTNTSSNGSGKDHASKWRTCLPQQKLRQEDQVLVHLTIPAALSQLVVGAHVQVQRQLKRHNEWSGTVDVIANGTVGLIVEAKRQAGRRRVRFPFHIGTWKVAPELLMLPSRIDLENYEATVRNEEAQEAKFMVAAAAQLKGTKCDGNGVVYAIVLESAARQDLNAVYLAVRVKPDKDRAEGEGKGDYAECDDDAPSEPDSSIEVDIRPTAVAAAAVAAAAVEAAAYPDMIFECAETGRRMFRVRNQWFIGDWDSKHGDDADCVVETTDGLLPIGNNEWAVRTVEGSWVNTTLHTTLLTKEDAVANALEQKDATAGTY